MNTEEKLFPEANKLTENEEGTLIAHIVDEELDVIDVEFHYDGCVHVITKELTFLTLSRINLLTLNKLIIEADEIYEKEFALERKADEELELESETKDKN